MTGAIARMRILRGKLALIRNGFGAAVMPPEVKRLALSYAAKINDGHMGPRKFWRLYLPRLQYHNPNLTIAVERRTTLGGPATLTVEFAGERRETIDCQHMHENDIVKQLFEMTRAKQLPINEADSALAKEYLEEKERQQRALITRKARRAAKKEEERLGGGATVKLPITYSYGYNI